MENASKALIMAGSLLISLLIIGALVFMYNQFADVQQTKTDVDEEGKLGEYSKKFEDFNRVIYGSELLSLANLQEDYNKTQANEKGYTKIEIKVMINKEITRVEGKTYNNMQLFKTGSNTITQLSKDKKTIEGEISRLAAIPSNYTGKTVKYYSQLSNMEIAKSFDLLDKINATSDFEYGEALKKNEKTKSMMDYLKTYKNLTSSYTEFKNKRFKCTQIKYDQNNGRVTYMKFVEQ